MNIKVFAILFLLVSLLTQQVSAGVMNASMSGSMNSSTSSEMSSGEMMTMSHQHHQMGSQMDDGMIQDDAMDMKNMDCCQNDCTNCLASCQYVIPVFALQFSSVISKEAIQLNSSEPPVQSPSSPFRPPIAA